jgi:hypothetical protein
MAQDFDFGFEEQYGEIYGHHDAGGRHWQSGVA